MMANSLHMSLRIGQEIEHDGQETEHNGQETEHDGQFVAHDFTNWTRDGP